MITRRLPGIAFERQPSQPRDILPRMDIALFVGFAANGPLNQPVPLESEAQFTAIFGGDAPLVWDAERGETVYAYLAPAVRAFFRNGGTRCWAVRVAGAGAVTNTFTIPGLARANVDSAGTLVDIETVLIGARSPGRWSDDLAVSAVLLSRPLSPFTVGDPLALPLDPTQVKAGDWLRLTFSTPGSPPGAVSEERFTLMYAVAKPHRVLWFGARPHAASPAAHLAGTVWLHGTPYGALLAPDDNDGAHTLTLDSIPMARPQYGEFLRAEFGGVRGWLMVEAVSEVGSSIESPLSPPAARGLLVEARGLWPLNSAPSVVGLTAHVEVLTMQLFVREGVSYPVSVSDLGFDPAHPRYWGALPDDDTLYRARYANWQQHLPIDAFENEQAALWREVTEPRFPIAALPAADNAVFFPLAMQTLPENYIGASFTAEPPLVRDGLHNFNADLFLDPLLKEFCAGSLLAQADFLRYGKEPGYVPVGIHTLLELDEVTIAAVPDLAHRGWREALPDLADPTTPDIAAEAADPCTPLPPFEECAPFVLAAPMLSHTPPDDTGSFTLSWGGDDRSERFILQEVIALVPTESVTLYEGTGTSFTLYRRPRGHYFYRVRANSGEVVSEWSAWMQVTVGAQGRWQLLPADQYTPKTLLEVQQRLIQLCAARADVFAVLALPDHYREDAAALHVDALRALFVPTPSVAAAALLAANSVTGFCYGEARALTYAALYHPWVTVREASRDILPRTVPPDGMMCGMIAFRALTRGAWIAPANELLRDVVALQPPLSAYFDLLNAGVNTLRHEARGFLCLSADTLATDEDSDLRSINVRRLLILLRRLALQQGVNYVFEPNSDSFRRLVQRTFESSMRYLFTRGAFAGNRPDTAYRVVVDATVNPPQSVDAGRLIVELRVAPSQPLTFMTVRLVQVGDRTLQVQLA